jgi:hypothetical protein
MLPAYTNLIAAAILLVVAYLVGSKKGLFLAALGVALFIAWGVVMTRQIADNFAKTTAKEKKKSGCPCQAGQL